MVSPSSKCVCTAETVRLVGSLASAFTVSVLLMAMPLSPTSTLMVTPLPSVWPSAAALIFGILKEYWPSSVGFSATVTASVLPSGI